MGEGFKSIDWSAVENKLFELSKDELSEFACNHYGESFCGFAFDLNIDCAQILLCLKADDLNWSVGDWRYQGINDIDNTLLGGRWESEWEPFETQIAKVICDEMADYEEDDQTQFDPTAQLLLNTVYRVLFRLEESESFQGLKLTPDFAVLVLCHDDTEEDARSRLYKMRMRQKK